MELGGSGEWNELSECVECGCVRKTVVALVETGSRRDVGSTRYRIRHSSVKFAVSSETANTDIMVEILYLAQCITGISTYVVYISLLEERSMQT